MCLAFCTTRKNKIEVADSLIGDLCDRNIRVQGYIKAYLSLQYVAIKLNIKYEICTKK